MEKNYQLAVEVAETANVIKGYGSTHHNGWANFQIIMEQVVIHMNDADAAKKIAELRKAALADENGAKLRATLGL